ncbi:MAG TPA: efflux RND transporter periplasmic adaptor subunit, partial [Anaeromyxobacteraceae bacterium]|nr:efflux RND transporter periplasmic adaptor subunit [Anaeromyxobacteraceae bacterium]
KVAAGPAAPAAGAGAAATPQPDKWQCPMHPSIVQDHPGDCPICGMKLVKVLGDSGGGGGGAAPAGLATVTIDPARQQLIGLKIVHVERGPVGGAWRTNGRVAVDETRIVHVPVKFGGFMEKVYGDFVGKPVRRGQPLFTIYSPELFAAQEEYLLALRTRRTLGEAGAATGGDGDALLRAARRKLELWDVAPSEIERIEKDGQPSRTLTFFSPASGVLTKKEVVPGMKVAAGDMPFEITDLSSVWFLADAYEADLRRVKVGMKASLSFEAFPGRRFDGRVAFIDPLLDPKTRTAKVRIDVPNPAGDLKPELFGEAVLAATPREAVRVPADAVIDSGTQKIVFVSLGDGKFQPREVRLGDSDGTWAEVTSGLDAGDGVVTRANFLIDSESRLRASLQALTSAVATDPMARPPAPAAQKPAGTDPHAGHGR